MCFFLSFFLSFFLLLYFFLWFPSFILYNWWFSEACLCALCILYCNVPCQYVVYNKNSIKNKNKKKSSSLNSLTQMTQKWIVCTLRAISNVALTQMKYFICLLIHIILLSKRTLERILNKKYLWWRKNKTNVAEVATFIEQQLETSGQCHGYRGCTKNVGYMELWLTDKQFEYCYGYWMVKVFIWGQETDCKDVFTTAVVQSMPWA